MFPGGKLNLRRVTGISCIEQQFCNFLPDRPSCVTERRKGASKQDSEFAVLQSSFQHYFHLKFYLSTTGTSPWWTKLGPRLGAYSRNAPDVASSAAD